MVAADSSLPAHDPTLIPAAPGVITLEAIASLANNNTYHLLGSCGIQHTLSESSGLIPTAIQGGEVCYLRFDLCNGDDRK